MKKYIPLDVLVAEIEKLISNGQVKLQEAQECNDDESYVAWAEHIATCIKILSILDTLEVKEVDLEKEIDDYVNEHFSECDDGVLISDANKSLGGVTYSDLTTLAKHFFELGLHSTITEEDCKLIWNIGDEIPAMSEEEFFKELLRRYKAQKGK